MSHTSAPLPTDDALVDELRRVSALADPVPAAWLHAAVASLAWQDIDAEPAALAYDSLSGRDPRVAGGQPGTQAVRELRYAAGAAGLSLEVDVNADRLRVVGDVSPAAAVEVVAVWPEGQQATTADDLGAFRFDDLPRQ
ncbi:MAG TPA: hypothetical protein VH479_13445, partial [Acidimicrobiales bacterium]